MVYNPVTNQAHSGLSNHYLLTTSRNRFALDQCIRLTKGRTLKLRRFVKALLTIHTKWTQYTGVPRSSEQADKGFNCCDLGALKYKPGYKSCEML